MCMLCGNMSQIPNEIQAGSSLIQYVAALPVIGLLGLGIRDFFRSHNKIGSGNGAGNGGLSQKVPPNTRLE